MKIGWGWKIVVLYSGFVGIIVTLVVASTRQQFDLVSKDYYQQEIAYQNVIDAGKNQSTLSRPMDIHADNQNVIISFPQEFKGKVLAGDVKFYAPVNEKWDRNFKINADNNTVTISRTSLMNTRYTIKINCLVDGKNYYQESEIQLHS
jgi:hypothetical protein